MPSVAFGTGIYAFVLVLHSSISPELKAGVALILTMAGLAAQLWMYARHNPRTQSPEVTDQLARMTSLVELIVRRPDPTEKTPHPQNEA
jgi:hypothetical protein